MKAARNEFVTIHGTNVEVRPGKTTVYFTAGANGDHEAGIWHFWTAYGEDEFGDWKVTARALEQLPPEERFTRIDQEQWMAKDGESRLAYRMTWRQLETVQYIRPATIREVAGWMVSHSKDAKYAEPFTYVNGKQWILPSGKI